jgi:hypothetical protein
MILYFSTDNSMQEEVSMEEEAEVKQLEAWKARVQQGCMPILVAVVVASVSFAFGLGPQWAVEEAMVGKSALARLHASSGNGTAERCVGWADTYRGLEASQVFVFHYLFASMAYFGCTTSFDVRAKAKFANRVVSSVLVGYVLIALTWDKASNTSSSLWFWAAALAVSFASEMAGLVASDVWFRRRKGLVAVLQKLLDVFLSCIVGHISLICVPLALSVSQVLREYPVAETLVLGVVIPGVIAFQKHYLRKLASQMMLRREVDGVVSMNASTIRETTMVRLFALLV